MLLPKKDLSTPRRVLSLALQALFFIAIYWVVRGWTVAGMASGSAPRFVATDLHGERVSLADYRGRPLLLHFWASWCRICKFEEGAVSSVAESWPVLTVAMQSGDDEQVRRFMQERGLDWRTIVDETGELAKRFGVRGTPAHFILDGNGRVRYREMGYTTSWGLKLRLWLAGRDLSGGREPGDRPIPNQ